MRDQAHVRGCLIGGAIGDALGWPVEFDSHQKIVSKYGAGGIQDLELTHSGKAHITDDTQMTLFTAEGMLRARTRGYSKGICHVPSVVYYAYQRWLLTQGYPKVEEYEWVYDGWLLATPELHARRAPGTSCLTSLLSKQQGTTELPVNDSKGCGGVMRVAPAGLFYQKEFAFQMAVDFAAITHGHPTGYLTAGALAYLIAYLLEGTELSAAVQASIDKLCTYEHHEESLRSLRLAVRLAESDTPELDAIRQLGGGWIAEEALAIAVYCSLKYRDDFRRALIVAVNHSGDSDSTGAITGNILGAYLGIEGIPAEWIEQVELRDIIMQIADDLLQDYDEETVGWDRYPGY